MFHRFSVIAGAVFLLGIITAQGAEMPVYEVSGLPITPHQMAVLSPANASQGVLSSTSTLDGMPASPHQVAVLGGRVELVGQPASSKRHVARER